jgi:hypothetical protein
VARLAHNSRIVHPVETQELEGTALHLIESSALAVVDLEWKELLLLTAPEQEKK